VSSAGLRPNRATASKPRVRLSGTVSYEFTTTAHKPRSAASLVEGPPA
jgi:hypothetical protein